VRDEGIGKVAWVVVPPADGVGHEMCDGLRLLKRSWRRSEAMRDGLVRRPRRRG
jgi:hypothetical protein